MAKKLNPIIVEKTLREKRIFLFSKTEFARLFEVSQSAATFFLFDHCKTGFFIKIKNGLYALNVPFSGGEQLVIANKLYWPSYISLEYALARYHLIPESVYAVTSVTPKATREFVVKNLSYTYTRIQKRFFTGYQPTKIESQTVLMATPEKALADYLYLVELGKRSLNDRLSFRGIRKDKFFKQIEILKRDRLMRLAKKLL